MAIPRILSLLVGPYSGSMYYRQELPAKALHRAGYPILMATPAIADVVAADNSYDVLLLSRAACEDHVRFIALTQQVQPPGKLPFVGFDGNLIDVPPCNPAYHSGV